MEGVTTNYLLMTKQLILYSFQSANKTMKNCYLPSVDVAIEQEHDETSNIYILATSVSSV